MIPFLAPDWSARLGRSRPLISLARKVILHYAVGGILATSALATGPVQIESLLTKATADSVRIEYGLSSQTETAADLDAKITRLGSGTLLWKASLDHAALSAGRTNTYAKTISNLKPELWSPATPALYSLTVTAKTADKPIAEKTIRFGFRSFESRDGRLFLNGRPIFLRGLAINPPGRTIPEKTGESRAFAEDYVRFLKSRNVNIIRLTHDSQVWFDVCDELGMMIYQGQYGSPLEAGAGKKSPPKDFNGSLAAYKNLFSTYASHPSIVIYVLSNELPVSGSRGKTFHDFLTRACSELKMWDPTRLYIGNAGYGEGREGDICDVHRYWGWYYNTFLTFYNLRDPNLFTTGSGSILKSRTQAGDNEDDAPGRTGRQRNMAAVDIEDIRAASVLPSHVSPLGSPQPLTFSECVGNFTGPLGEYNIVLRKQLGAQLNWTGHSAHQREDALEYQSFAIDQIAETFRRLRPLNPRLSGLMPFTILFYNWSGITNFRQMKAKPAADALARAYQPVLLSWENWTPQVYAGSTIKPVMYVINDADDGAALKNAVVECQLVAGNGREVQRWKPMKLPSIQHYSTWSSRLELELPPDLPTGDYKLIGIVSSGGRVISQNATACFVARKGWGGAEPARGPGLPVFVYDPAGATASALEKLQIRFQRVSSLSAPPLGALIIGELGWDAGANSAVPALKDYIRNGGRILCLRQDSARFDTSWLPAPVTFFSASANDPTYPPATRPFRDHMNINPERPAHPLFAGLDRKRFALWSDYTNWEQTRPGFPRIYPVTAGFKLAKDESFDRVAILANYDRGLEGIALCEMFEGKGSVVVSGFDIVSRAGLDPVADRFLANLVRYAAAKESHEIHPLVQSRIEWGNYASERGVINGPMNGLVVNVSWVRPETNPSATPLAPEEGAWNTRPGDQFVPRGRKPFGPYGYTTSSSLRDLNPDSEIGSGFFWARIPDGKRSVKTVVENPSSKPAEFSMEVNESSVIHQSVPAGQTRTVSANVPPASTNVCVRFTGSKTLVILETEFE